MMRFQVLSSTVSYSSRGRVTLSFYAFPYDLGELKFSDGNRLLGCDLSEMWGRPLTVGDLTSKLKRLGYKNIDNDKFWPMCATIVVTSNQSELEYIKKKNDFGDSEISICGYASYHSSANLTLTLIVDQETISDLLMARVDMPETMFFNVNIFGLDDLNSLWDLEDDSHCGDAKYRLIGNFGIERVTPFFPDDRHYDRRQKERQEDKEELTKLRSTVGDLVAIETGRMDGAVAKLLRLNLLAVSAIVVIGILALVSLYF